MLFPFDDEHRYHRPAALIASAWGGKFKEQLEFLSPTPEAPEPEKQGKYSKADLASMNALMKFAKKA
jgi:hypothetical protein